ncbi:aldehyde dehydrogenase, partial [Pseudomonas sp. MWU13-2860]
TVALAPIAALLEQRFGIARGYLTTLHPWLGQQRLLDGPAVVAGADGLQSHFALGRSAVNNLSPKTTSAVKAADAVLPGLSQRLQAPSYRVPTSIVSSAVLNVELKQTASPQELSALLRYAEQKQHLPILRNSSDPLVSHDYLGSPYSAIVDQRWTEVQHERHARLLYWYDNEWGYSSRVVDLVALIARDGQP